MRKLISKLRQNKGETLTEVLVGLLIACIATAMFAAMLQSSSKIMTTSGESLEDYYAANDALASQDLRDPDSRDVTFRQLTIKGTGAAVSKPATIQLRPGNDTVTVNYYPNDEASVPVASYKLKTAAQNGGGGQ